MTISTIRKVSEEDYVKVKKAAESFCTRHDIAFGLDENDTAENAIHCRIHQDESYGGKSSLRYLWQKCYCRALGEAYDKRLTIGYGYVGTTVE